MVDSGGSGGVQDPRIKLAVALLEKKLATMSQAELEAMARNLRASEKGSSGIGRAMLETIERCLGRGAE